MSAGRRPAPTPPAHRLAPLLLLALALALRLWGIGWGLPDERHYFSYHPDEVFLLRGAAGVMQGDWNPHFFNYGTLYIYLVALAGRLLSLCGPGPLAQEPAGLHLVGRAVTAFLGAATVYLTLLAGRRLGGLAAGLLAAGLLAIAPLHLVHSHYATVDVPATFWFMMAVLAVLGISDRPAPEGDDAKRRALLYVAAGLSVGLAAATKYTLALAALLLPAAWLLSPRPGKRAARWLLLGLAVVPVGFLIGCPYVVDWRAGLRLNPEFLRDAGFELRHMRAGGTLAFVNAGNGWSYHLLRGLPAALGWPLCAAGLGAVVWAALSGKRELRLLVGWAMLFFLFLGSAREWFVRYLVPLIPILCLLLAVGLVDLYRGAHRSRGLLWASMAGASCLLTLTALYAAGQLWGLLRTDPRDRAADFLAELAPASIGLPERPWYFSVPVSPINGGAATAPYFDRWAKTARPQVMITGWEAAQLHRLRPAAYALTDLEYHDLLRLERRDTRELLAAVVQSYSEWKQFGEPPPFGWLGVAKAKAPPDALYPWPTVTLHWGWRADGP